MADGARDRPSGDPPIRSPLSELFTKGLLIDGASISVVAFTGNHSVVSSTGATAAVVERVQFDLGEGPHWDVLATGRPVLIDDLEAVDAHRWPAFGRAVAPLDVGSMFSFPMLLGAATVGVVDLMRHGTGRLSDLELRQAISMTRSVTPAAVHLAATSAVSSAPPGAQPEMRREVHQATGMIAAQLDTTTTNAFAALRAYAYSRDRPMLDVALDVVHRRVDLSDPT